MQPLDDYRLTAEQLACYLDRIGLGKMAAQVRNGAPPAPDAATLATLQQAHLWTVPFENLAIAAGDLPLELGIQGLFDKVVSQRRGGICYELNLLYAAALQTLGFSVALRGARHPKYGDDFDHVFLQVDVSDHDVPLLADVGFAVNFLKPLQLEEGAVQRDGRDRYQLLPAPEIGGGYLRLWMTPGTEGEGEAGEVFTFGPAVYQPSDFLERCTWYCTNERSRFVQGPLVSIDALQGRKTLSARHYIVTAGGRRTSVDVESPEHYAALLRSEFLL